MSDVEENNFEGREIFGVLSRVALEENLRSFFVTSSDEPVAAAFAAT